MQLLKQFNYPPVHVFINIPDCYPTIHDWNLLINNLPEVFRRYEEEKGKLYAIKDIWGVIIAPLGDSQQNFNENNKSYTLIVSAPYHKNEEKNLYDKLDDACYNIVKHSLIESPNIRNSIFIHLPITASFQNCKKWVVEYFTQYPEKPVSTVILYQPSVTTDQIKNSNSVHHCIDIINKDTDQLEWQGGKENLIEFSIPFGNVSSEPSELKLVADGKEIISVDNNYIYQKGIHYLDAIKNEDGTITGGVSKLTSGIKQDLVVKLLPDQDGFVLSGRYPQTDELSIL